MFVAPTGWPGRRAPVLQGVLAVGVLVSFTLAARGTTRQISLLAGVLSAVLLITWVARHVRASLIVLLIFLPLQQVVLAFLYARGLPAGVTRDLGFVKEMVVLGVVLAALRTWEAGWDLRRADWWALSFLGMAAVYAVLPLAFPGTLGAANLTTVVSALRLNCLFIVLFLACRRLPWSRTDRQVLAGAVGVATAFLALGALWERFANPSFIRFSNQTLHIQAYKSQVLQQPHIPPQFVSGLTDVGGQISFRVGSWLYDFLGFGYYLILPLALCCCLLARRRVTVTAGAATLLVASSLVITLGRSSLLGGLVAVLLIFAASTRYRLTHRARLVLLSATGLLLVVPFAGGSELTRRALGAFNGTDHSTNDHTSRSLAGLHEVLHHPWGHGLGSNFVTAVRESTGTGTLSENTFLQIGNELGVIAMVLFIAFTLSAQADLRRVVASETSAGVAAAVWAAGWGLAVNGLLLQVWVSFPTALTFWALAGVITAGRPTNRTDPRQLPAADDQPLDSPQRQVQTSW